MIFIGIGSNLPSDMYGVPQANCEGAVGILEERGLAVTGRGRWYESAPVPVSDQPWFVNGVVTVVTDLSPQALLDLLHDVEYAFGRVRRARNEARILDLDLIAYDELVIEDRQGAVVPHPRLHQRAFVLLPMRELEPDWVHPVLKTSIGELVSALAGDQEIRPVT